MDPAPSPTSTWPDHEVVVAGYAQLPQNTGAGVMWRHLTIIVRVDTRTHRVVDVATTLATRIADEFVHQLLFGRDLSADQAELVRALEARYFGNGRKAIIGACRDLTERYLEVRASHSR